MTLGLFVLGGGGDIGPEASTTALTAGMVNWMGDHIKQAWYATNTSFIT